MYLKNIGWAFLLQGKGKGKKKGKGKCFPDDSEETNFQGFKENPQVKHKLRTLDVFAGVGGEHSDICGHPFSFAARVYSPSTCFANFSVLVIRFIPVCARTFSIMTHPALSLAAFEFGRF